MSFNFNKKNIKSVKFNWFNKLTHELIDLGKFSLNSVWSITNKSFFKKIIKQYYFNKKIIKKIITQ
jgi:hypothetical protein